MMYTTHQRTSARMALVSAFAYKTSGRGQALLLLTPVNALLLVPHSYGDDDPARICWKRGVLVPYQTYTGSLHPFAEHECECFLLLCACDLPCQHFQVLRAPLVDPHAPG